MKAKFTFEEVADMLGMSIKELESEIDGGDLGFTYDDGEKMITLYDLEKYMGGEQAMKITQEYLKENS